MNYAKLEVLGITVPIGKNEYHDDGYVDSIEEHVMQIYEMYGFDNSNYNYNKNKDEIVVGKCGILETNLGKKIYHIFYLKQTIDDLNKIFCEKTYVLEKLGKIKELLEALDIQRRAHEEGHVIIDSKNIDVLEERMLKKQNVKIDFSKIKDKEVKAELGVLYALHQRGISSELLGFTRYKDYVFDIAKEIYEQYKLTEEKKCRKFLNKLHKVFKRE